MGVREVILVRQLLNKLEKRENKLALARKGGGLAVIWSGGPTGSRTSKCALKKLDKKRARLETNSWSLPLLRANVSFKSMDKGMTFETFVRVSVNMCTSLSS
jgi:hypothetical protein